MSQKHTEHLQNARRCVSYVIIVWSPYTILTCKIRMLSSVLQTWKPRFTAIKETSQQPQLIKNVDSEALQQTTTLNSFHCNISCVNLFSLEPGVIKCCFLLSEVGIMG